MGCFLVWTLKSFTPFDVERQWVMQSHWCLCLGHVLKPISSCPTQVIFSLYAHQGPQERIFIADTLASLQPNCFLFSPNHVCFRRSAWHSEAVPQQKRQLLGNRIAPPERNGWTTMYRMMIASFSVLPVFFFPKKKKTKENGKWLAPAIQVALTVWLVELLSMSRICQGHTPEENHSQHGRNINPNLLLESVVTLLPKGFMENEQNFDTIAQ